MRKHKEVDTVTAILEFLHAHRIPAWRVNQGAMRGEHKGKRWFFRFGATGMSDILAIAPNPLINGYVVGKFCAIEVKSATGRVSPSQQSFLDQVNAAGGKAFVARSVADVQRELGL